MENETELYTVEWDDDLDAVLFTWEEFASGERFREGANDLLECFQDRDSSKMLVDTSGIRGHREEDTQ
ncbi:hypothetical protein BRC81_02005 [Halobacteriales archaeon QS_1_68_20]|nr:MAG: hypothetical protein BRC81_02005 [Halobacteriales archaeon QS_1_68_20]